MVLFLVVAGGLAECGAWFLVARRRAGVWTAVAPALAVAGLAGLATGRIELSPRVSVGVTVVAGLVAGVALWVATRVFVWIARRWPPFERNAEEIYDQRKGLSLPAVLAMALGLAVTGEELFWRGLVQGWVSGSSGRWGGAAIAWGAYLVANLFSASLVLIAGAIVAGAVWGALAAWTGGVLAPILCHDVWTALMILRPPGPERTS